MSHHASGCVDMAGYRANVMTSLLQIFKYVTAMVVALSLAVSGLVALFFMAFCDHGPFLICLMYAAIAPSLAWIEVALQIKAWGLMKQRRHLGLALGLLLFSIAPTLVGAVVVRRILE